jgi:hypothetical protein
MTYLAWLIVIAAAALEVGGDALTGMVRLMPQRTHCGRAIQ